MERKFCLFLLPLSCLNVLTSPFNILVLFPWDLSVLFSCRSFVSLLPVATEGGFLRGEAPSRFVIFFWESTKKFPAKENSKNTETNPYFILKTLKPRLRKE